MKYTDGLTKPNRSDIADPDDTRPIAEQIQGWEWGRSMAAQPEPVRPLDRLDQLLQDLSLAPQTPGVTKLADRIADIFGLPRQGERQP